MKNVLLKPLSGAVIIALAAIFAPVHAQQAGEAHKMPGPGQGPHLFSPDNTAESSEVLDRLFGPLRQAEDDKSAAGR